MATLALAAIVCNVAFRLRLASWERMIQSSRSFLEVPDC